MRTHWLPAFALLAGLAGCIGDSPTAPAKAKPIALRAPTSPENLIFNLEAVYNDRVRQPEERLAAFQDLFAPDLAFIVPPADLGRGLPASWGLETEVAIHRRMFEAQARREIRSLALVLAHPPAAQLDPPQEGRDDWKEVFVPMVALRLLWNAADGLDATGGQCRFLAEPRAGRWYIREWIELQRPRGRGGAPSLSVDGSTWAWIKARFLP